VAKRKTQTTTASVVQEKDTEEFVLVPRKYLEKLQTTLKEIEGCRYCKGTHASRAATAALRPVTNGGEQR